MEWLVGKETVCIYNCQLGIEMNDMYDTGYEASCMLDFDNFDVGYCPMGSERLTKVLKNHMLHESM